MGNLPPIPIICGPTASGKTGVAVTLAGTLPIEVVSADSRQIIKHLDIGTAKPTPEECKAVEIHLVDIVDPGERYSAYRFIDDANRSIGAILSRGNIPVVVGGTGLYLRALSEGVVEIEGDNLSIRKRLEQEIDRIGAQAMYERLEQIDPLEAARLHPNNKVRVIRALEIFERTGKTRSELAVTGAYHKSDYKFQHYCLAPLREKLYERINGRVDEMMAEGWLDELTSLIDNGRGEAIRKSNVIGYRELLDHIYGKYSLEEAIALIKQNTRRYAKRQMTWFRHQGECEFFESRDKLVKILVEVLSLFPRTML
ncbi:MAG: tRNA (adenosine(37)-N6)-dimethylallyltransferase MiaA [candidate division Zixibacteria bacterium]|nr:tRNA (adenosine(37)-N6)-dimethylallyltransferase MiaA [candidate division Zixibacteria bacterium]